MVPSTIVQIVPNLPPVTCGVGDHATQLALRLLQRHNVNTQFLVCNPKVHDWKVPPFEIHQLRQRTCKGLQDGIEILRPNCVVLHYSGYGYSKRGIPGWLARSIEQLSIPVITMFHELFATGPITSSAYWFSFLMRRIARRIERASAKVITNRDFSGHWLRPDSIVSPVFSNFGEIADGNITGEKQNWLVIFPYQQTIFSSYWGELNYWVRALKPSRIIAIGKRTEIPEDIPFRDQVESLGVCGTEQISALLTQSQFAYLSYFPDYMGKSSILAALAAHRVTVLFGGNTTVLSEGLVDGVHLLGPGRTYTQETGWLVAKNLFDWYQSHSLDSTADKYFQLFQGLHV